MVWIIRPLLRHVTCVPALIVRILRATKPTQSGGASRLEVAGLRIEGHRGDAHPVVRGCDANAAGRITSEAMRTAANGTGRSAR
jgi:hypothetical protein